MNGTHLFVGHPFVCHFFYHLCYLTFDSNDEFSKVALDVRENGFHWLHKTNPEDRPVHQVTKGSRGNSVQGRKTNHFPGNRQN